MHFLSHNRISIFIAVSYTLVLFILVSLPSKNISDLATINDKIAHLGTFTVLAIVWLWAKKALQVVFWGCILFGIFIEFWQGVLPESFHRSFDWLDALADGIGTAIGLGVFLTIRKLV